MGQTGTDPGGHNRAGMNLIARFQAWERGVRQSFNVAPTTPETWRRARTYMLWFDHGVLRKLWANFFAVAPGVYRSNHPDRAHLARMKALGITTVLNLRGVGTGAVYLTEQRDCADLGMTLLDCQLTARNASSRADILDLIDTFRRIERPFVMHCKSGADRSGLAAAIWLMVMEGAPVSVARRQLGVKYIHFRWTRTGVLDHILDLYEARQAQGEIGFEDWIRTEYDHDAVQRSFDQRKGKA